MAEYISRAQLLERVRADAYRDFIRADSWTDEYAKAANEKMLYFIGIIESMPTVEAEEMPHWIDCDKQMPEQDGLYLTSDINGFVRITHLLDGEWWAMPKTRVIAWQTVPSAARANVQSVKSSFEE